MSHSRPAPLTILVRWLCLVSGGLGLLLLAACSGDGKGAAPSPSPEPTATVRPARAPLSVAEALFVLDCAADGTQTGSECRCFADGMLERFTPSEMTALDLDSPAVISLAADIFVRCSDDTVKAAPEPTARRTPAPTVIRMPTPKPTAKPTSPPRATLPAARVDHDSLEYKLASIEKGNLVSDDDPLITQFRTLLNSLDGNCRETRQQISDQAVRGQQIIRERGGSTTLSTLMKAAITASSAAPGVSCAEVFATLIVLQ